MLRGFKEFITRGNAIDLAVGVVIGAAFTTIVNGLVDGLINPLIALVFGKTDLTQVWAFHVGVTAFQPGLVLDAAVKFLMVALALYLCVVAPINAWRARREKSASDATADAAAEPTKQEELLTEIRDLLARR